MCVQKASCHSPSFFLFPTISFALSRPSEVSGTKQRCMCGVFSSMCTTAERKVPASWRWPMNSMARSKKALTSASGRPWKNSGLAVTSTSTTRTLSLRVRQPTSRMSRSASWR